MGGVGVATCPSLDPESAFLISIRNLLPSGSDNLFLRGVREIGLTCLFFYMFFFFMFVFQYMVFFFFLMFCLLFFFFFMFFHSFFFHSFFFLPFFFF